MTSRSIPWQFEWKRPEWQSPSDERDDEFFVDGVPVSCASAQVSLEEAREWREEHATEENDSCLLLVATLYSTGNKQSADVLLVQLFQYEPSNNSNGAKRLEHHRMLRWPAFTMNTEEPEKKSWWMGGGKGRKEAVVGLVSVTLCRRPVGEDVSAASAADAMDVVALLSLGLETSESSAVSQKDVEPQENQEERDSMSHPEKPTDLILACLTSDGRVFFYSLQAIFQPNKEKEDEKLENGLTSLLLGNDIHRQLEQTVLPLSQPLAIVPLSVPLKLHTPKQNDTLDVIPEDFELPEDEIYEEEDTAVKQDLWEGSFWDANVEASTAKYHSVENDPKLLISAFDFVVVAGQGTRIRRVKRRRKKVPSSSRGSSVSSWETASQQEEEKWELSAKALANTGDSVDSSGWWQENRGQAMPMDDESSDNSKKRQEKSKTKWVEYREAGGFVTFISNRYYAETRTVFLPFAPKQLSAIVWGGLHFVIVLGDESLAPAHAPLAMAIRVDSFDVMKIPRGESPSTMLTREPSDDDASKALPGEKKKQKRKQMCSVRRFHLIPILLPSKGSSSSEQVTAVAVSSTLTDPPAIALQYSSQPELSGDLLVTLNSFRSLDVVPTVLTHRATGGYRRFGKEPEKGLAIRTHQEQGHVARIPHTAEPSTTRNTWCHVGQVGRRSYDELYSRFTPFSHFFFTAKGLGSAWYRR